MCYTTIAKGGKETEKQKQAHTQRERESEVRESGREQEWDVKAHINLTYTMYVVL